VSCAARHGTAPLRAYLARADPEALARIAPSDLQRTVRAVELARSGPSSWSERLRESGTWGLATERYPALKIGLDRDRRELAAELDRRVERFFAAGLVAEVEQLLASGVPPRANAFKAIGYREVLGALARGESPAGALAAVQQSTRRYSKRQRTWFRKERGVVWLDAACGTEALAERVIGLWR
jgi:tRNA dimethylallyltransferase